MKKFVAALAVSMIATTAFAQVHVDGYTRRDGTYVAPHYQSSPDSSRTNNYSSQGNYNPYTGATGHVDPYAAPAPSYGSGTSSSYGGRAPCYTFGGCPH